MVSFEFGKCTSVSCDPIKQAPKALGCASRAKILHQQWMEAVQCGHNPHAAVASPFKVNIIPVGLWFDNKCSSMQNSKHFNSFITIATYLVVKFDW